MSSYPDDTRINLETIKSRLLATDLVPSRQTLTDDVDRVFSALAGQGIGTLADLRTELKTPKKLEALAAGTEIGKDYLTLLRREIESWFPKPFPLKEIDLIPADTVEKLAERSIKTTADFLNARVDPEKKPLLTETIGPELLETLTALTALTRVQWVSPNTARMLMDASYGSVRKLAEANAEELSAALERVNENGKYYKGKIGLRDVKRLIRAAGYVTEL